MVIFRDNNLYYDNYDYILYVLSMVEIMIEDI